MRCSPLHLLTIKHLCIQCKLFEHSIQYAQKVKTPKVRWQNWTKKIGHIGLQHNGEAAALPSIINYYFILQLYDKT